MQHAHRKGNIHRDLKGRTSFVTFTRGAPVPEAIELGLAYAMQQERLTHLTVYAQLEQLIDTPLPIGPEQAEMSGPALNF